MLSTALLDQMRDRQEASFDQAATIQTPTETRSTAGGGYVTTWANASTAVPCRVAPSGLSPMELTIGGQVRPVEIMAFTFAHDVAITAKSRIVWPETGGSTYFLISDPDYGYKTATRVRAAKVS